MHSSQVFCIPDEVMNESMYPDLMEESSLSAFDDDDYADDMSMDDFFTSFSSTNQERVNVIPKPVTPPHTSMPSTYDGEPIALDRMEPALISPYSSSSKEIMCGGEAPCMPAAPDLKTRTMELDQMCKEGLSKLRESMKKSEVTRSEILRQRQILGYKLPSDLRA
jgi:hypothetical protein